MDENRIDENIPQEELAEQLIEQTNEIESDNEQTTPEEIHRDSPKKKTRKKNAKLSVLIRMLIIFLVSAFLAVFIIFGFKDMYGLEFSSTEEKDVYIEKGSSVAQIAQTLYENDIIDIPILFRAYCKFAADTEGFQYGYHTFSKSLSYKGITNELRKLVKKNDVVEITVIEGWNLYDISRALKEKGVISNINDFTKAVERMAVSYGYVKDAPANKYRYYKYEGYFYPDKYEFYVGTDDYEGIAKKFFANFERHMDDEIAQAVKESKYSFDEILTIASLIQAEAGNVNEMGKVSSVFHNRLNSTLFPNLQSDVTINYVERAIKPTIAYEYQELYDAYNTYKRQGLMPGPICNPSKQAIRAALFPNNTNYYFFVTDNTGKYYYANTYAQHLKNCNTAQRVNASL